MKIKVRPEDFVVQERLKMAFSEEGQNRVYLLHKRGWNTVDAVGAVARASGVPAAQVRYAGLKDRHAVTTQYVSVPREYTLAGKVPGISPEDLRLEQAGFSEDFVSTRNLTGNSFDVVLRSLEEGEVAALMDRLPAVRQGGFPNYFDDQRFGSVPPGGEFVAERVLRGHLKGALRLHLTAEYPGMGADEKAHRQAISDAWGDWDAVLALCRTGVEKRVIETLRRGGNKKNLLEAVNVIPRQEMTMYFAAFQAALWNQVLRSLVQPGPEPSHSVAGKAGPYIFPEPTVLERLQADDIPTVARRILPCRPQVSDRINSAIAERGLKEQDFNLRGIHNAYLKSFYRNAVVVPQDLEEEGPAPDDLYRGRLKVRLTFSLPKGSYATMLLKALCGTGGEGSPQEGQDGEGVPE